jgi:hypothetical protein
MSASRAFIIDGSMLDVRATGVLVSECGEWSLGRSGVPARGLEDLRSAGE